MRIAEMAFSSRACGILALAWLAACGPSGPSIDAENEETFVRSLAVAKNSVSPSDRTRLENAIFAMAMSRASPQHHGDGHWEIKIDSRRYGSNIVPWDGTVRNPQFVAGIRSALESYMWIRDDTYDFSAGSIIAKAAAEGLSTDDPVRAASESLRASVKSELDGIAERLKNGVVVSMSCNDRYTRFWVTNQRESKWPIVAVWAGTNWFKHEFPIPLQPGETESFDAEYQGTINCPYLIKEVAVEGGRTFAPVTSKEMLEVRNLDDDVSKGLQELLGWLRSIH